MSYMSTAVLQQASTKTLRVAVVAADELRRAELLRRLRNSGHVVAASVHEADVVLCDGDATLVGKPIAVPLVTLGGADNDQGGALPAAATEEQIDATLRAVALGLIVRTTRERAGGFSPEKFDEKRGELRQSNGRPLLTPREVEMLSAIGSGLGNKAIARQLDISLHTVKFHIESLFRKLGARSRAEAVAKGLERSRNETVEL